MPCDTLTPHQQAVFLNCDKTVTWLNSYIKKSIPHAPFNGSFVVFCESARRLYPSGIMSLDKLEQKLDSHVLTPEDHRQLCRKWMEGWRNLIMKVVEATAKRR